MKVYRGAGGSRTRVQTRKQQVFYMLIPDLFFVRWLDQGHRPAPYLFYFHRNPRAKFPLAPNLFAPPYRAASWQQHPGNVLFQNLVSELSVKTYCNSVTQQERNYFRQL